MLLSTLVIMNVNYMKTNFLQSDFVMVLQKTETRWPRLQLKYIRKPLGVFVSNGKMTSSSETKPS